MLTHDRALDLAATAIDFELSAADRTALGEHLATCSSCRANALTLRRDAGRLMALRPVPPPAWVALSIGRRRRPLGLAFATAALVLSSVLAAAAIAGSILRDAPEPDASPSQTAVSRPAPRPYPSTWLNTALRVTASSLILRQVPALAGAEIATAQRDSVLVTDATLAVDADGYDWYHAAVVAEVPVLAPLPGGLRDTRGATGWVAVRSAAEAFAIPIGPRCPSGTPLTDVVAMLEAERLACFEDATIELMGVFSCSSCETSVDGAYGPAWLAGRSAAQLVQEQAGAPGLELHLPPESVGWPPNGSRLRVRGHFDDPAALTCGLAALPRVGDPENTFSPVDIESIQLLCRQAFVVEAYDVISGGTGAT